jgi:putative transposase
MFEINNLYDNIDRSSWAEVDPSVLNEKDKMVYEKRKIAIDLFLSKQKSSEEVSENSGISVSEIYRLADRCLLEDENGVLFGYRALIPNKRLATYKRKELPTGCAGNKVGAFSKLLDQYPSLADLIELKLWGKDRKIVVDKRINIKHLHKRFVRACKEIGLSGNDYPFTSQDYGKRSLERYVIKLKHKNFSKGAGRFGEDAANHANKTGIGFKSHISVRPYQRVQFDGHRIDTLISLKFTTPDGLEIIDIIDRLWILAIIDEDTRMILGYHISLNKEYNKSDVLHCIRNAIVSSRPKIFSITGLNYHSAAGFPTWENNGPEWSVWEELLYDNAKSHLSKEVEKCLKEVIGCSVNPGPVNSPERRGLIENFFLLLEENGFHRLPSTTGSHLNDPVRIKPEKYAVKYEISEQEIRDLAEVLIANYNGTPHSSLYNLSPLEVYKQRLEQGTIIRNIPDERRSYTAFFTEKISRTIKGNLKKGRRPYINYEGAQYRGDILSRAGGLIGQKLTLHVNTEDLRVIKAFLPDGSELGLLQVAGRWRIRKHSLTLRKTINRLKNKKLIHFTSEDDPIEIYGEYLRSKAKNNKSSRNKLAGLSNETGYDNTVSEKVNEEKIIKPVSPHKPPEQPVQRRFKKTMTY